MRDGAFCSRACYFRVMLYAEAASVRRGDLCGHSQANSYFICLRTRAPSGRGRAGGPVRRGLEGSLARLSAVGRPSLSKAPKTRRLPIYKILDKASTPRAVRAEDPGSLARRRRIETKKLRRTRAPEAAIPSNLLAAQHPTRRRQDARAAAAAARDDMGLQPPLLPGPDRDHHAGL